MGTLLIRCNSSGDLYPLRHSELQHLRLSPPLSSIIVLDILALLFKNTILFLVIIIRVILFVPRVLLENKSNYRLILYYIFFVSTMPFEHYS